MNSMSRIETRIKTTDIKNITDMIKYKFKLLISSSSSSSNGVGVYYISLDFGRCLLKHPIY